MKGRNRIVDIAIILLFFTAVSVFAARGESDSERLKQLPVVKSIKQDPRVPEGAEPTSLVKIVVGWDNSDRSIAEVRQALDELRFREGEGDLSEVDVAFLYRLVFSLNAQYHNEFPAEIKAIKTDISRLLDINLRLPKRVRDKIPAELLSVSKEMSEYPMYRDFNTDVRGKFRTSLSGMENKALEFAMKNFKASSDSVENKTCLKFLLVLENEALEYYRSKKETKEGLSRQEKSGLPYWGKHVEHPDSLRFVIDALIDDREIAPYAKNPEVMGKPYRYCDRAFNIGFSRLASADEWVPKGRKIAPLDKIKNRDIVIAKFKTGWDSRKKNLKFDTETRKFLWVFNKKKAAESK